MKNEYNMSIKSLRKEIDKIDHQIVKLLNKRADLCFKIVLEKQKQGLLLIESVEAVDDRVAKIFANITKYSKGPLQETQLKAIYIHILSSCVGSLS